jgi:hypothetical protein
MKTIIHDDIWEKSIRKKEYNSIIFQTLTVKKISIIETIFTECTFKDSIIGLHTQFIKCRFIKCTFSGKYGTLGPNAHYTNTQFEKCSFIGEEIIQGVTFKECIF